MAKELDDELRKAFSHLHQKMVDSTHKLILANVEIDKHKRTRQRAELTVKEISSYPADIKTYESVGRMFLLDDIENIRKGLHKKMEDSVDKIKSLESSKTHLQQDLKECENNIREMVQQRQGKGSSS